MKKIILTALLAVSLSALAFSVPSGPNAGFILLHNLAVWKEEFGGKLAWQENLTIGDKVTLLGRTQNFTVEGRERDYILVKTPSGKEGWVRTPYVAVNSTLGVVKSESALIFSEPRDLKVTANDMKFLTIVAILDNGSTREFAKVAAVNPVNEVPYNLTNTFLSYPDLTINENDVAAAVLYYVGKGTKNDAVKANLLNLATRKYASTVFFPQIQAALGVPQAIPLETTPFVGSYVISDDKVNVRANPSTDAPVVHQLMKSNEVTVKERTAKQATAGTKTDYWYHITAPVDGWVFGSFLVINP